MVITISRLVCPLGFSRLRLVAGNAPVESGGGGVAVEPASSESRAPRSQPESSE